MRYAPLVYLAKDERYGPTSASRFIRNSELRWSHDEGGSDHKKAGRGEVDETELGDGGYSDQVTYPGGVFPHGRHIRSNQNVRPNDGGGDGGDEGFFLDLDNSKRGALGEGTNAPVYFEAAGGRYITYWLFYAYNEGPFNGVAGVGSDIDNHEGDWERISVHLDRGNRAVGVAYYQHDGYKELSWDKVPKHGGSHPIVYSARGSHASYAAPGAKKIETSIVGHDVHTADDRASKGAAWQTWKHLTNVRHQKWYGYGGAWGEVGNPIVDKFTHDETTGPQGPSHKQPAPECATTNSTSSLPWVSASISCSRDDATCTRAPSLHSSTRSASAW
ncbi:MAG: Vps62-related protein [Kofleriaceae bacterium]